MNEEQQSTTTEQEPTGADTAQAPAEENGSAPAESTGEAPKDQADGTEEVKELASAEGMADVKDLADIMIALLKRFNGYNYCSVCMPTSCPEMPRDRSETLNALVMNYVVRSYKFGTPEFANAIKHPDQKFLDHFLSKDLVYVRVHKLPPKLMSDGMYDNVPPPGSKDAGVKEVGWYPILATDFKPHIIVQTAKDQFGMIEGDPYFTPTPEETATVVSHGGAHETPEEPKKDQQ